MGRGLVIITVGMVFIFGMVQLGISSRHNTETGINIEYANWVQARNYAGSGMEMAANELYQDFSWRPVNSVWVREFDTEIVNITFNDNTTDVTIPSGQVRITSECVIGSSRAIVNGFMIEGGKLPHVPAAMAIYSDGVSFDASGTKFEVDGNDASGLVSPVYGIAGGSSSVVNTVLNAIDGSHGPDQRGNIKGLGDTPPSLAEVPNMNEELKLLIDYYKQHATITHDSNIHLSGTSTDLGTDEAPQITYIGAEPASPGMAPPPVTLKLTGGSSGAGILIIGPGAKLDMSGGAGQDILNFNGLIIVQGEANIGGSMVINGAMLFGGYTPSVTIGLNGSVAVRYHSENINKLDPYLDSVDGGSNFRLPAKLVSVFE